MSPSKKWNRGFVMRSLTRSEPMSMPNTSQPVSARTRFERWWPMKPLTPRMQSFFMSEGERRGVDRLEAMRAVAEPLAKEHRIGFAAVERHGENSQPPSVRAVDARMAAAHQESWLGRRAAFVQGARAVDPEAASGGLGKSPGGGGRHRAHQVGDGAGRLR